jgi:transketolase
MSQFSDLEKHARYLRNQVLDMCIKAGTGHVTSSFSCVEILVALYYGGILRFDASNPKWDGRDRFILSKGQASPILYALLADLEFFSSDAIWKFAQNDGMFGVHLQSNVPGAEITSGSLGHGFGIAVGMALAAKMDDKSHLIFSLLGDGECYEGSIWESALFASHHKLTNLVAIVDRNQLCVTDYTEKIVRLNPLDEKWRSFGWEAVTIDGHSFEELMSVLGEVRSRKSDSPLVILANTIKGKGVSFMEGQTLWHGVAPKGKEAEMAKAELSGEKA